MPADFFRTGRFTADDYRRAIDFIRTNFSPEPESVFLRLWDECSDFSHEENKKKLFFLKNSLDQPPYLSPAAAAFLNEAFQRLEAGEPVQYIVGKTAFFGREFRVGKGVLIPRFDTETLVEQALRRLPENGKFADLCCGSGCVGISLLAERESAFGFFADIAPEALDFTTENACRYGVLPRAEIQQADVTVPAQKNGFCLIVSNPPYIPTEDLSALPKEVRSEPRLALDGGSDGLDFYRAIVKNYKNALLDGGSFVFECGIGQARPVGKILEENGFTERQIVCDAGGIERVVAAKKA